MALPLPYAPNIDADAERLRMAGAEAQRPNIDVGASVAPALTGAMALKDALDTSDKKRAAEVFQTEYLSKGKAGLLKAYEDAGKPADFNPDLYVYDGMTPEQTQNGVLLGIKALAAGVDKVKDDKGNETYAASIEADDPESAAAIRAGTIKPDTVYTQRQTGIRATKTAAVKEAIASAKRDFDAIQKSLDRGIERLKIASKTKQVKDVQRQYDNLQADLTDYQRQISSIEAAGVYSIADQGKLTDLRTRARDVERRLRNAEAQLPDDSTPPPPPPPPPPADGKPLTDATKAKEYLQKAGGDKTKARELAKKDGYTF